jgi:D-threo-aldose 1-dehydrogenase
VSELSLGALGYGAANLGNLFRELSDEQCNRILETAWDVGIRYFDTAPHYGLGRSERRLGAFLRTKPRHEFVLSTKVGRLLRTDPNWIGGQDLENDFHVPANLKRVWAPSRDGIRASLDESLERLGLDRVDILYLHDPEFYDLKTGIDEALPALADLRSEGIVDAIGVGSMSTHALIASAATGILDLLMVAGRYTLADQSAVPELIDTCSAESVSIVTAAVFNSGLLSTHAPVADARFDYGDVPPELLARVDAIRTICDDFGVSIPAAALQYTLRDPLVTSVVVGASEPEQLSANARRIREDIPADFWSALTEAHLIPR